MSIFSVIVSLAALGAVCYTEWLIDKQPKVKDELEKEETLLSGRDAEALRKSATDVVPDALVRYRRPQATATHSMRFAHHPLPPGQRRRRVP